MEFLAGPGLCFPQSPRKLDWYYEEKNYEQEVPELMATHASSNQLGQCHTRRPPPVENGSTPVKRPRIVLSDAAAADILEQSDWYQEQSGDRLAKRWESAVTSAALRVVKTPGVGALCKFKSTELHGVRRISLRRRISCILPVRGFLSPAQIKENR